MMGSSSWADTQWENTLFSSILNVRVLEGEEPDKVKHISLATQELDMTYDIRAQLRELNIKAATEIEGSWSW